jgi:hypothetical protein
MIFTYSRQPHDRKHGPNGYRDYKSFKEWLRDEFTFRCAYCQERERWYPSGKGAFAVDHAKPKGWRNTLAWSATIRTWCTCSRCNSAKGERLLLDPCRMAFAEHLKVKNDGSINGRTKEGKRLIKILGLDLEAPTKVRRYYIRVAALYKRAPDHPELKALYFHAFCYPDDLPDLASLRPKRKTKPKGIADSFLHLRQTDLLPARY